MLWPATAILRMAFMGMDLPLDRMDVLDGGVIEILAPDERLKRLQEARAGFGIARAGARLDHRGAFPVLAHAFVIGLRRIGGDRDLRGARIGAQAQIGAEDIAIGGDFGDQLHQRLHDIDSRRAHVVALAEGKFLRVVER